MPWRVDLKRKDGESVRCEPTAGDELTISGDDLIEFRLADGTVKAEITDIKSTAVSQEVGRPFFIVEATENSRKRPTYRSLSSPAGTKRIRLNGH